MPDFVKNIITSIAVPIIVGVATKAIPRDKIKTACFDAGKAVSGKLREGIGVPGEQIEGLTQDIAKVAFDAFNEGLDSDDAST